MSLLPPLTWFFAFIFVVRWIHRQFDSGSHCIVIAIHVDLSRYFCIFAVFQLASVHEYVVGLLAVLCVARGFAVVLHFEERAGHQLMDCPMSQQTCACHTRASRRIWSRSRLLRRSLQLRIVVFSNQHVYVGLPASVGVLLELRVNLVREVNCDLQPELLALDGDSRESWPKELYFFDVLRPSPLGRRRLLRGTLYCFLCCCEGVASLIVTKCH